MRWILGLACVAFVAAGCVAPSNTEPPQGSPAPAPPLVEMPAGKFYEFDARFPEGSGLWEFRLRVTEDTVVGLGAAGNGTRGTFQGTFGYWVDPQPIDGGACGPAAPPMPWDARVFSVHGDFSGYPPVMQVGPGDHTIWLWDDSPDAEPRFFAYGRSPDAFETVNVTPVAAGWGFELAGAFVDEAPGGKEVVGHLQGPGLVLASWQVTSPLPETGAWNSTFRILADRTCHEETHARAFGAKDPLVGGMSNTTMVHAPAGDVRAWFDYRVEPGPVPPTPLTGPARHSGALLILQPDATN